MKSLCFLVVAGLISYAVALDCTPTCNSDEDCIEVNSNPTCVCNNTSYNGKKFSDFAPSLVCDGGLMVISISRCLLDYFGYDYHSFQLVNTSDGCYNTSTSVVGNKRVQSLQVKAQTGSCGNVMTHDPYKIYYTNNLHIGIQNRTLVNAKPAEVNFTCSYNLTMQTTLSFSLHPVIGITYLTASNGEGSYPLTMSAYKDRDFAMPFQQTDIVEVGADIFLGLFVSDADGDIFSLRTVKCLASPINQPDDPNSVVLVSGGCSVDGDVSVTVEKNGDTLESRIRLSSFQFLGYSDVYIFCNARLCNKTENCSECQNGRSVNPSSGQVMLSLGLDDKISYNSGSHTVGFCSVLASSLLVLLSIKLF